jgi:hypothetical protein
MRQWSLRYVRRCPGEESGRAASDVISNKVQKMGYRPCPGGSAIIPLLATSTRGRQSYKNFGEAEQKRHQI